MSFIELTDSEVLNIKLIDSQHAEIIRIVNKLHDELGAKYEGESHRLLTDLKNHLREHFDTEENMMKEHKYVNYFSHKLEHDRYYNKVNNYLTDIKNGKIKLDLEFLKSARRWFFNHLDLNDKKCAAFFTTKGIS